MTLESMYPVATQAISSTDAPRVPRMWGRATLVMLMSRAPMRAPGHDGDGDEPFMGSCLLLVHVDVTGRKAGAGSPAHIHRWDDRQTRPEGMGGVEGRFHDDLYGNALDDLDEVARRVLGGKEAEDRAGTRLHAVDVPLKILPG